jgi:molybdopterin-guanine dinucleotide biosynthesis protein A
MGRDKALLPHPEGGCWLERSLGLLAGQGMPVTLLSRHQEHRELAQALAHRQQLAIEALDEPPPWEGPLRALARLMAHHPHQRLLLCPVDMPALTAEVLQDLRAAAATAEEGGASDGDDDGENEGGPIVLAHDGERLQPLLGVYPSSFRRRRHLDDFLAGGERRLQGWLAQQPHQTVPLAKEALRNINHPADWELFRKPQP